jgi:hypothetical protein
MVTESDAGDDDSERVGELGAVCSSAGVGRR